MNKLGKAATAVGAATVLLLGGGTTLALWNDTATVQGGTVDTGQLSLELAEGTWSADTPEQWVPGDSGTWTGDITVLAEGDNLLAELSVDPSSIAGDPEVLEQFDIDIQVNGDGFTPGTDEGVWAIEGGNGAAATLTGTVTIEVDFPATAAVLPPADNPQNASQNQTVDLGDLGILLTQVVN